MLRGVDGPVALGATSRLLAQNLEEVESAEHLSLRELEHPDIYLNGCRSDASWIKI
jgi:hypothetical protein